MALSKEQFEGIKNYLVEKIREKLATYKRETEAMPFHYRLLGKDRMAIFSFVHSINTSLGQSVFERLGYIIAEPYAVAVKDQYRTFEGYISSEAVLKIDSIMRNLKAVTRSPDKEEETKEILAVAKRGDLGRRVRKRVDLFIKHKDGVEYYFELKTVKPNIGEFSGVKKQLLDWIAIRGSIDPTVKIKTIVVIPYNPYEPQPYERWTLQGLFDLKNEVLVAEEFWDFLGGKETYNDLLDVFEQAGLELYDEIDAKMKEIGRES